MQATIPVWRGRVVASAIAVAPPAWWLVAPYVGVARWYSVDSLLAVALLYPVLEEICFRGLLQGWLMQHIGNRPAALWILSWPNVLTSLAFVAAHLPTQPVGWAAATLLPSLVFGFFRERYDSVLPSILLHIYYNTGLILVASYVR